MNLKRINFSCSMTRSFVAFRYNDAVAIHSDRSSQYEMKKLTKPISRETHRNYLQSNELMIRFEL